MIARVWIGLAVGLLTACGQGGRPDPNIMRGGDGVLTEPCGDFDAHRNAYFGDLHVHTSYSFDSYLFGNQMNDPGVAYDFAEGVRIRLNDNTAGERHIQLQRPLDFAAVTDHAEYLGEVRICSDPGQLGYYDPLCVQFRASDPTDSVGFLVWGLRLTRPDYGRQHFCAYSDCPGAARSAWEGTVRTADARNRPCEFTTFNAYEYSPSGRYAGMGIHVQCTAYTVATCTQVRTSTRPVVDLFEYSCSIKIPSELHRL